MATTILSIAATRWRNQAHLVGATSTVPLDATAQEYFSIPAGFGDMMIARIMVTLDTLSGTYAAPVPPFDGIQVSIVDNNVITVLDILAARRWTLVSTSNARPEFSIFEQYINPVVIKQLEAFRVSMPIVAGAGITGRVVLRATGTRIRTA